MDYSGMRVGTTDDVDRIVAAVGRVHLLPQGVQIHNQRFHAMKLARGLEERHISSKLVQTFAEARESLDSD